MYTPTWPETVGCVGTAPPVEEHLALVHRTELLDEQIVYAVVGDQLTQISSGDSTKAAGIRIPLIRAKIFWFLILILRIGIHQAFVTYPSFNSLSGRYPPLQLVLVLKPTQNHLHHREYSGRNDLEHGSDGVL